MTNKVRVYNAVTYSCLQWDETKPITSRYHIFCHDHYTMQNCPMHTTGYNRELQEK